MLRRCFRGLLVLVLAGACAVPLPAQDAKDKLPAPAKADLAKAEELIKDIYKTEFKKADDDSAAAKELAASLLKQGRETNDDTALKFAALSLARDVAAKAGDHAAALEAIDELAAAFDVSTAGMKGLALAAAVEGADKETAQQLGEAVLELVAEALAADDYEGAAKLVAT